LLLIIVARKIKITAKNIAKFRNKSILLCLTAIAINAQTVTPGFLTKKEKKGVKNCENVYVESI